jgi:site-specific recombinase XerD
MNLDQTFSILFWLRRHKTDKKGLAPIWIRITVDGKRAECSTSRKILSEHWDAENGAASNGCPTAKVINDYLASVRVEITRRYNILLTTKDYVSAEDVKENFRGKKAVEKPKTTVRGLYNDFIKFQEAKVKAGELSPGRFKRFPVTRGKCESFMLSQYKTEDLPLDEIKSPFLVLFQHYLLTQDRMGHNTSMKHAKDLKQVFEFGVTMGHLAVNPVAGFKCTNKKVKRTFLTTDELNRVIKLKFAAQRLEEVRDCFVFSCFTGYAFIDARALAPENLTLGIDGNKWIIHDRTKTDNPENVPLLPVALEIVEKYAGHPYCVAENKLLPINSNQRYNEYLKEIADLAGIDKKLTTHVARHTFATTVCLTNGVPIETVQKLLAHGDIRTTQIYAQIVPIKVSADMQELRKKLMGASPAEESQVGNTSAQPAGNSNFGTLKKVVGANL